MSGYVVYHSYWPEASTSRANVYAYVIDLVFFFLGLLTPSSSKPNPSQKKGETSVP